MKLSNLKISLYKNLERFLGKRIVRGTYLSLCIRRYSKSNCIFIHIPKAGGTSISHAIMGKGAGHFTATEVLNRIGKDKFDDFFSFAVTRNPYRRILSSYNFIKNGGGTDGSVRREEYFKRKEFDSFESFILDWLPYQDLENKNLLFKPQYKFICDSNDNILVNYVGKLEKLDTVSNTLENRLNKKINIVKKNITDRPISIQKILTGEIKNRIFELYQKDFEILGYKK